MTELRIVSGNPTPEEVAALVAVLAASSGAPVVKPEPRPRWTGRAPWASRSWRGR